nr:MAG TPA: hypothetical protein [Caudoviricetes sp.]
MHLLFIYLNSHMRVRTSTAQTSALCYDYFWNYYGFLYLSFLTTSIL